MTLPDALTEAQQLTLSGEQYIRDVLEQARKVRVVAERLGAQPPKRLSSRQLQKREMATAARPSSAKVDIQNNSFSCCRNFRLLRRAVGEMMGFWARKCPLRCSSGTMLHERLFALPWMKPTFFRHPRVHHNELNCPRFVLWLARVKTTAPVERLSHATSPAVVYA